MPEASKGSLSDRLDQMGQRIEELSLYLAVFEHASDGMAALDTENRAVAVNPAFCAITGYEPEELLGRNPRFLAEGLVEESHLFRMREALAHGGRWQGELLARHKSGRVVILRVSLSSQVEQDGAVARRILVVSDITEARETAEQLWRRNNFDPLTDLPNRNLFLDRLLQSLVLAGRETTRVALLFIGLDGFKNINDSLGHWIGDKVLQEAARRFLGCLRQGDTVARFGGDEFTVALSSVTSTDEVEAVLRSVLEALQEPFVIEQHQVLISCSIGICLWPGDGDDVEALMRNATSALQQAKLAGRNTFRFFTPAMDARAQARSRLADELAGALAGGEFHLVFQPLVDLKSGKVAAAETLLRWHNRYLGMVSPEQFVPLAEELGLIGPIGQWLVGAACAEARKWQNLGLGELGVAVNMSPRQFRQGDIVSIIEAALAETRLDPSLLTIEITEGLLLANSEEVLSKMDRIRALGVALSVDDFGTGYSSLSYLKTLPVDVLKIDRSFVSDMLENLDNATLVDAIIAMGHSMRLTVVAEGVETEAQRAYLTEHGCDSGQGYLFSPPLSPARFRDFVLEHGRRDTAVPVFDAGRGLAPCGVRVLFADDQELVRLVFRDFLDGTGCVVDEAADGAEAIRLFQSATTPYDLVVLDLRMPGADGYAAARGIRAFEAERGMPRTVVIALTGDSSDEDRRKAMAAGFDRFLSKPIARADLLEALAETLPPELTDTPPAVESQLGVAIPEGLEHLLGPFVREMERDQQRLRELSESGDRVMLAEHAHAMKGKAGMFGEDGLYQVLGQIEASAAVAAHEEIMQLVAKVVERVGRL